MRSAVVSAAISAPDPNPSFGAARGYWKVPDASGWMNPLSLIAVLESFPEDGVNVAFSTEEGKARFEFLKVVGRLWTKLVLGGVSALLEELEHSR